MASAATAASFVAEVVSVVAAAVEKEQHLKTHIDTTHLFVFAASPATSPAAASVGTEVVSVVASAAAAEEPAAPARKRSSRTVFVPVTGNPRSLHSAFNSGSFSFEYSSEIPLSA